MGLPTTLLADSVKSDAKWDNPKQSRDTSGGPTTFLLRDDPPSGHQAPEGADGEVVDGDRLYQEGLVSVFQAEGGGDVFSPTWLR